MSKSATASTSASAASAVPATGTRDGGSAKPRRRGGSFLYTMGNLFTSATSGPGSSGRRHRRQQQSQQQHPSAPHPNSVDSSEAVGGGAAGAAADIAAAVAAAADSSGRTECPVCAERLPTAQFPALMLDCGHFACRGCLATALRLAISEGMPATCLACSARLHPDDVNSIVGEERLRIKYEQFTLRRVLASDPDCRWCPAPDCKYAVIASGCASCPKLECPVCGISFCYHCKTEWHPSSTCEQARIQRHTAEVLAAAAAAAAGPDPMLSSASGPSEPVAEIKQCPRCATYISKENDGSCNHMRCKLCGSEFCWLCRKEINDLHYLSPSGCTFWGKKPWSRKKKIMWQLGTLVGAPVGIALLAGLAVPAIIVGLPVWAGRRLRHRLRKADRHTPGQRRCLVALAVTGSLIVSPLVAVVTVGVAVPILLAYVYGVVPVSLCRSDGCAAAEPDEETAAEAASAGDLRSPATVDVAVDARGSEVAEVTVVVISDARAATSGGEPAADGCGRLVRVRADVSPATAASADGDDASVLGLTGSLAGYRNQDCNSVSVASTDGACQQPLPTAAPEVSAEPTPAD